MKKLKNVLLLLLLLASTNSIARSSFSQDSPRIVNIINFIRQIEPRRTSETAHEIQFARNLSVTVRCSH